MSRVGFTDPNDAGRFVPVSVDDRLPVDPGVSLLGGHAVRDIMVIPAAGNYSANDVMSNDTAAGGARAWRFQEVVRKPGDSALLTGLRLKVNSTALTVFSPRVHLFRKNPTASELRDNVARSIVAADQDAYLGYVDLPLLTSGGVGMISFNYDVRMQFTTDPDLRDLFAILETLTAETNEVAGMTVSLGAEIAYL